MSKTKKIVVVVILVALLFGFGIWIFTTDGEQEYVEIFVHEEKNENAAQPPPIVALGEGTFESPFPLGKTVEKQAEPGIVHRITVMEAWTKEGIWHNKLYVTFKIEILGSPGKISMLETGHFAVLGSKGIFETVGFKREGIAGRILTGTENILTIWILLDLDDSDPVLIWDREFWRITPEPAPRYFFDLGL